MSCCNQTPTVSISHSPAIAAIILLSVAAATASLPATARADYGAGGDVASASATELSDQDSTAPAVSRDGRYVVFTTTSPLLLGPSPDPAEPFTSGLLRKDVLTGALDVVAPPDAIGPTSISADGRYVLFSTPDALTAADSNNRRDVYLRDMSLALSDVAAYELVSSLDGPEQSPDYPQGSPGSTPGDRGQALSSDGRTAVFWTDGISNLAGPGTPRAQVFVRALDRQETRLVTREKTDPTLPGEPAEPTLAAINPHPVVSGDGTTVAWQDSAPELQLDLLPGEPSGVAFLWRDMRAGPGVAARRATGIADQDDPACDRTARFQNVETITGPCYGPFSTPEAQDPSVQGAADRPLSISHDGRRLLFLSPAHRRPFDPQTARAGLYLVDMAPGLSRKQATSEPVSVNSALTTAGRGILQATLAPDGRHIALVSRNNAFDGPRPVGSFQTGELIATNVFVLDLGSNTIERATRGFAGGDYTGPIDTQSGLPDDTFAGEVAVSHDASVVAFQARDGNLFVGDANGVADIQVVRRVVDFLPPVVVAQPDDDPIPGQPKVKPLRPVHPLIGYVKLGAHGVATLRVRVPAAGRLIAEASGRVGGRRLIVDKANRRLRRAANTTLRLWPSKSAVQALRRRGQLPVTVKITYRPRRGATTKASRRYTLDREALR
jgi:hypothetical protein